MFEITQENLLRIGAVVNRNLLLVRYSFERIAKSFKRGELQRRWGGKVTIGKTRSKSEVRGKRVRGMAGVVRAGQGACVVGCCEGDSKPAHARPAYAARKFSARACRPPPRRLGTRRCSWTNFEDLFRAAMVMACFRAWKNSGWREGIKCHELLYSSVRHLVAQRFSGRGTYRTIPKEGSLSYYTSAIP